MDWFVRRPGKLGGFRRHCRRCRSARFSDRPQINDGQHYLNEFTFRFNRRFYPFNAFRSLLGIGGAIKPPTYDGLYDHE